MTHKNFLTPVVYIYYSQFWTLSNQFTRSFVTIFNYDTSGIYTIVNSQPYPTNLLEVSKLFSISLIWVMFNLSDLRVSYPSQIFRIRVTIKEIKITYLSYPFSMRDFISYSMRGRSCGLCTIIQKYLKGLGFRDDNYEPELYFLSLIINPLEIMSMMIR